MKNIGLLVVVLWLLFSCDSAPSKSVIREYYPIDSLVTAQVNFLAAHNAKLVKSNNDSVFNEKGILLDSNQWAQELEVFQNLHINKPTLVDAYTKTVYTDSKSNLDILSYTTPINKLTVQKIDIYYFKSLKNIKRITAEINVSNTLYNSSKYLQMEFIKVENKTVLSNYIITGSQKMALRDNLEIKINGKIYF